ncbi:MAG: glycosyltransferase family 2 protein [Chitinophagales bacterium]|nr:glycosyltransferase family 2 protein [Chitinophagales bacterium]
MPPFFSIIIPTYNRAHFIRKAIESVLAQTFSDWELIVVDDGSTDNTKQVVFQYTDVRIKYMYQQNAERSAARNNGIKQALGKYICFLDSDDYFLPERLGNLYQFLIEKNFPQIFIYTAKQNETEGTTSVDKSYKPFEIKNGFIDQIITDIIHCQQTCIAATILKENLFNEQLTVSEDMELWVRIAAKHKVVCLPNDCSVVIVHHDNRTVTKTNYGRFVKQLASLNVMFGKQHPGFAKVSAATKRFMYSYVYFGMGKYYLSESKRLKAMLYVGKAIIRNLPDTQIKHRIYAFIQCCNIFRTSHQTLHLIEHGYI